MASLNRVLLIGNLGKDPEVRTLDNGTKVAKVALATTEKYKDRNGQPQEQTEWHNLEIWGEQARIAEQYLRKGKQIFVEGKIKTDSWEDNGVKKYRTVIRVSSFTMLGNAGSENVGREPEKTENMPPPVVSTPDISLDDLPF